MMITRRCKPLMKTATCLQRKHTYCRVPLGIRNQAKRADSSRCFPFYAEHAIIYCEWIPIMYYAILGASFLNATKEAWHKNLLCDVNVCAACNKESDKEWAFSVLWMSSLFLAFIVSSPPTNWNFSGPGYRISILMKVPASISTKACIRCSMKLNEKEKEIDTVRDNSWLSPPLGWVISFGCMSHSNEVRCYAAALMCMLLMMITSNSFLDNILWINQAPCLGNKQTKTTFTLLVSYGTLCKTRAIVLCCS